MLLHRVGIEQQLYVQTEIVVFSQKCSSISQASTTIFGLTGTGAVGGECTDGSVCVNAHVQGYGGDGHLAEANSPLPGLLMGLEQFKQAGVPADRVVIGLPWYGYDCK